MARDLLHLPTWTKNGMVRVVVESPKGSAVKFDYDPDLEVFAYGKALPLGLTYPYCWGFLPGTRGDDGDPLDVFVLTDAPSFPGVIIECRLVGVLRLEENAKKRRQRVTTVSSPFPWQTRKSQMAARMLAICPSGCATRWNNSSSAPLFSRTNVRPCEVGRDTKLQRSSCADRRRYSYSISSRD